VGNPPLRKGRELSRKAQIIVGGAAVAAVGALAAWLASRSGGAGPRPADAGPTVVDMTGRSVRLPAAPRRILSLCTSAGEALAAMGQAHRVAAIDEYGRVVRGVEHAVVIGKGSLVSREQVLALGIDLAFVWWYQDDAAAMLEGLSVPVVRIRSARAAELPAMIRLVGLCVGSSEAADEVARHVEGYLRQPVAAGDPPCRPRVYLELYGAFKTVGRDTYLNDLLELAGAVNVARDASGSVLLSAERLMEADPDVILFVEGFATPEAIAARPGLSEQKAVRSARVHPIDRRWLVAGPNLPRAVEKLREAIGTSGTPQGS